MKKVLLFLGITALALQDYFKKQPVKTTRQQQFIQTGETSQAFIEGVPNKTSLSWAKKNFTKLLGVKPIQISHGQYQFRTINKIVLNLYKYRGRNFWSAYLTMENSRQYREIYYYLFRNENIGNGIVVKYIFEIMFKETENEDYKKLYDIANAGDWELALEIAKGQNLL